MSFTLLQAQGAARTSTIRLRRNPVPSYPSLNTMTAGFLAAVYRSYRASAHVLSRSRRASREPRALTSLPRERLRFVTPVSGWR